MMKQQVRLAAVALLMCVSQMASAQTPGAGNAPLGSSDFKPSPGYPVGFRGDWTGRFPGATPPTEWSRRVRGITTELRYQADKPAGTDAGKDAQSLEYFTIKDWLVAGPFNVNDPIADMEKDFIGGEATIQPSKDAKIAPMSLASTKPNGELAWRAVRVGMDNQSRHDHNEGTIGNLNVDFLFTFGTITLDKGVKPVIEGDFVNKVAYGHTYIWAPADAKVRLSIPFAGRAGRYWLNGKAADLDPKNSRSVAVDLAKGWNRLLIKVSTASGVGINYDKRWLSNWRFAAYLEPADAVVSYETKGIAWMTRMTGRSMSGPVVVGERLFIGAGISDLMCIDKKTGKVLWMQSSTAYDAMTPEARAAGDIKDKIEPLLVQLEKLNADAVAAINANVSPQGMSSDKQAEVDKVLRAKSDMERKINDAFAKVDRAKYPPLQGNEVSSTNSTPVTDGKYIYWVCGGGMKGPGAYVFTCFDLDGKRQWAYHEALGAVEHGTHLSPALADGKLIFAAKSTLIALDAKTGKEVWRNTKCDWDAEYSARSPIVASIGADKIVIGPRLMYNLKDGTPIGPHGVDTSSDATPIIEDGILINPRRFMGFEKPPAFVAARLPASIAAGGKPQIVAQIDGKESQMPVFGSGLIASPVCVNGVVYSVDTAAGLVAVDLSAKKVLYRQWLEGYDRYNRYVYGVCSSPTLAGGNIYVTDDAGYTHIVAPGPTFKELARNPLENIHQTGAGGNPCRQESFYTSPWFEGKSMYLKGEEYLYCIGGK